MQPTLRRFVLTAVLAATLPLGSCATLIGTAVSPITGGVDLCRVTMKRPEDWWMSPFVFIGGAIAGPFVAFYNGVNYDPRVFRNFNAYWHGFDEIFQPFQMISK